MYFEKKKYLIQNNPLEEERNQVHKTMNLEEAFSSLCYFLFLILQNKEMKQGPHYNSNYRREI